MLEITDENIKTIIKSNRIVVIDCWAEWCAPCRAYSPIFESCATSYPSLTFGKLNVDQNPKTCSEHDIMGIPTTLIFCDGQVVNNIVGMMSDAALHSAIQDVLK